jgi:hypothetical protein
MELTESQKSLIKLVTKREDAYEKMKKLNERIDELMSEIGVDKMFQDPETKVVYKIVVPTGRFVEFKTIDYKRTNKIGENRGGTALSKKEATEAGFKLES